jgi:hypothetical protein
LLLFYYISSVSSIVPVLFFIFLRKNILFDNYQRKIFVYTLYRFITDLVGIGFENYFPSAYPIFHFTVFFDFIFFTEISASFAIFKLVHIRLIQFAILILALLEGLIFGSIWENNWITTIVSYTLISFIYFMLLSKVRGNLEKYKIGFLFTVFTYYSIMLIYFVFEDIIRSDFSIFIFLEPFILALYLLFNLSLSYTTWISQKK